VGRTPRLPRELLNGPFTVEEAERAGIGRSRLRGANWKRIAPSIYIWSRLAEDPIHLLAATLRRLPTRARFSGLSAAWLYGLDLKPCSPIEATVPLDEGVSARSGVALRRCALDDGDIVQVRGLPATSALRTVAEVCSRLSLVEAVVVADAALHKQLISLDQLKAWVASHPGARGVRNLRRVVDYAEPATESPMESRLRMLLVLAGLPRPKAQVKIRDRWGRVVGIPDLYYEDQRLGIEYDGSSHRESLPEDNRRQNRLLGVGVRLLRFTGGDVFNTPESLVRQVKEQLTAGSRT
jgi:very-short-patch-repair endonuclease